jgi:hypothetical protein
MKIPRNLLYLSKYLNLDARIEFLGANDNQAVRIINEEAFKVLYPAQDNLTLGKRLLAIDSLNEQLCQRLSKR